MRINDGALSGARLDPQHDIDPARNPASAARSPAADFRVARDSASAQELAPILAAVEATDEIRAERVREVSQRLLAGEYETRESAEGTADILLNGAG